MNANASQEAMTWEQCVKFAELNNPDIAASLETVKSYEAKYHGSHSTYFPQITASGSATYNPYPSGQQNPGSSGSAISTSQSSFGSNSSLYQYTVGMTLSQTLYDGGLTPGNVAQAVANYRGQIAALLVQKALVSYDLKSAFAQLLYAQELMELTKKIVARRRSNADMICLKFEGGRENKGAYLLAESDCQQAVLDLHNAERNVVVSQHQLMEMMGISIFNSIVAAGKLTTQKPPDSPDFAKLAAQTPTHFQQISNTKAASAGITVARSGILPTISASASAERYDQQFFTQTGPWSAGVSVSIPVFDGNKTYFNVKAADAALRQSLANLRSSDNSSVYTLVQAHSALLGDIEAVNVNRAKLEAQRVRSEIAEGQYSDGLISFTDFNLIENDLVTAEKQELLSRRDAVMAEANWEYAQGKGAIL